VNIVADALKSDVAVSLRRITQSSGHLKSAVTQLQDRHAAATWFSVVVVVPLSH
jgi:hypothetical protein